MLQAKLDQFAALQQRRKALESTSEESLTSPAHHTKPRLTSTSMTVTKSSTTSSKVSMSTVSHETNIKQEVTHPAPKADDFLHQARQKLRTTHQQIATDVSSASQPTQSAKSPEMYSVNNEGLSKEHARNLIKSQDLEARRQERDDGGWSGGLPDSCHSNRFTEATPPRSMKSQSCSERIGLQVAISVSKQQQSHIHEGHGQQLSREISSSFENIYDAADLSMYSPFMDQVDKDEFRQIKHDSSGSPYNSLNVSTDTAGSDDNVKEVSVTERIKQFQQQVSSASSSQNSTPRKPATSEVTPGGQKLNQAEMQSFSSVSQSTRRSEMSHTRTVSEVVQSSTVMHTSHQRTFSFGDSPHSPPHQHQQQQQEVSTDDPQSPSWYVPKPSELYDKREAQQRHSKHYDAKCLMEEEAAKFEDYKRDYRRWVSERESTSGTSGDEGLRDEPTDTQATTPKQVLLL